MSKDAFPQLIETLSFSASGFTQLQAAAYIALLKMGEETGSAVANESGINRSKIYDILNQLEEIGAIKKISRDGKTKYEAIPPDIVLSKILDIFKANINNSKEKLQAITNLRENINPVHATHTTLKLKDLKINDYKYIISSNEVARIRLQDKLSREDAISKEIMILDFNHSTNGNDLIMLGNDDVIYLFDAPIGDTVEALKLESREIAFFINGIIRDDWVKDVPHSIMEDIKSGRINAIHIGKTLYMQYLINGVEDRKFERPVTYFIDDDSIAFIYMGEIDLKIPYRFFKIIDLEGEYGLRVKIEMANGNVGDLRMNIVENPLFIKNLLQTMSKNERQLAELRNRLRG